MSEEIIKAIVENSKGKNHWQLNLKRQMSLEEQFEVEYSEEDSEDSENPKEVECFGFGLLQNINYTGGW